MKINPRTLLSIAFICFQLFVLSPILGQENRSKTIDELQIPKDSLYSVSGYQNASLSELPGSITMINSNDFNQGNINDPLLLLRGKIPGLGVYQKGSDPNGRSYLMSRGVTSFHGSSQPLIVIDGIPESNLENLDPNDIDSFIILKDAASAAIYGIRGNQGVILITTKSSQRNQPITLNYRMYLAADQLTSPLPNMKKNEFIQAGGNDLGSETDWLDEVSQVGISTTQQLSISGGSKNTSYRISANHRNIDGILNHSGFDQLNTRASMQYWTMNEKLHLQSFLSFTQRESDFSFQEAFRYATVFNPTAPVKFSNGNYYQAIFFDNYNPVAMLEQNQHHGKSKYLNYGIKANYEFSENLSIHFRYGSQYNHLFNGQFYPNSSFYRGLQRNGLASRSIADGNMKLLESYLKYQKHTEQFTFSVIGGFATQSSFSEFLSLSLGNLPANGLGYYGIDQSADRVTGGAQNIDIESEASPVERVNSYFTQAQFKFAELIYGTFALRSDGSTRLGTNHQWGYFPSIILGVDLLKVISLQMLSTMNLSLGIGKTGSLPFSYGLAQEAYNYNFNNGGSVQLMHAGNKNLIWEEKSEVNIGLDFESKEGQLNGSINFYSQKITDLISEGLVNASDFSQGTQFKNTGIITNKGVEFSVSYDLMNQANFTWKTSLVGNHFRSILESYDFRFDQSAELRAYLGAPGQGSSSFIRIGNGEPIGQLWGPEFASTDDNGIPIFKDINNDDVIKADPGSYLAPDTDAHTLGNGLPSFQFGWSNQFTLGQLDLNAFFRGALGHHLVNTYRIFYEPIDPGAINSYNRVITNKAEEGLRSSIFSSLYVEKADFLRIDNLTLGYTMNTDNKFYFQNIRFFGTVQNAFTLTGYTGADPDPSVIDYGPTDNGGFYRNSGDPLSPGIDRRNFYYTARTFLLGIDIAL